jgi:hypothetical protein
MNTLSSYVSMTAKFGSNVDGNEPISSTPNKSSACSFKTSSSQSSSISLTFMTSTFQTQLTNKYYVLRNLFSKITVIQSSRIS